LSTQKTKVIRIQTINIFNETLVKMKVTIALNKTNPSAITNNLGKYLYLGMIVLIRIAEKKIIALPIITSLFFDYGLTDYVPLACL
jgi:hypothetical protein